MSELKIRTRRVGAGWGYEIMSGDARYTGAGFGYRHEAAKACVDRMRRLGIMGWVKPEEEVDMAHKSGSKPAQRKAAPQVQPRTSSGAAARKVGAVGETPLAASFPEAQARRPAQKK